MRWKTANTRKRRTWHPFSTWHNFNAWQERVGKKLALKYGETSE